MTRLDAEVSTSASANIAGTASAAAIIDALGKFFITPSVATKEAAIVALHVYFEEIKKRGHDASMPA